MRGGVYADMASNRRPNIYERYARTWGILVIAGATAVGVALIALSGVHRMSPGWRDGLRAVGESVIASIILYVLVSALVDPKRQEAQARQLTSYVISQTTQQFQERFAVSLPTAVFESSEIPKPGFSESFVEALRDSARYEYLGATGYFTTFRLDRNRNRREFQRLDQIRLSILDPSADSLIRAHAEQRLRQRSGQLDQATVDNEIALLRTEIFISLVTLFDIRQNLSTSVFLHRSLPFFRCEMFDHAMYLTYYLGRMQYPETLQFTSATRPYRAYYAGMEFVRRFSTGFVTFGDGGPSADLIDDEAKLAGLLGRLGCAAELNDLRIAKEQKTVALVKRLTEVGISSDSPF